MYPGTKVVWEDRSIYNPIGITEVRNVPLYGSVFTSDKGPEEWTEVEGKDFFDLYGNNISFSKHGQPLLQAAMSINWGAKLLARRVVASDATLANLSIIAKVETVQVQKVDAEGNLIYEDESGLETVEETETPVMVNAAKITYSAKTVANCVSSVESETDKYIPAKVSVINGIMAEKLNPDEFLLFTVMDNGRGLSNKRFYITPDYYTSKSYDFTLYNFVILENGSTLENIRFALDPSIVMNEKNISIATKVQNESKQVVVEQYDENITNFIAKVQEISGLSASEIASGDILFGCDKKGNSYNTIQINTDTEENINLQHPYGQVLQSGTNGTFGDKPMEAESYATEMANSIIDDPTHVLYDVDRYMIDAFIDANYPTAVKRAIESLADFREDFVYFADMGIDVYTLTDISTRIKNYIKSQFTSVYCTTYDIIDPYSKKQINVTICYDIARLLIQQFNNGRNLPLAGQKYNIVISDAIAGTINFTPIITPSINQKEIMDDLKVNYASYIGEELVVQTLYTTYDANSQFSFTNNILAIQEVVKDIRLNCPINRYSFFTGDDFEKYKADITERIEKYKSQFEDISMEYIEDDDYIRNKIFYAAIKVQCKNFIQSEYFRIIAVNSTDTAV